MVRIMEDKQGIAIYNRYGDLVGVALSVRGVIANSKDFLDGGIRAALKSGKIYKDHFFHYYNLPEYPPINIEVPYLCIIDGVKFMKQIEVAEYCGVTKQAVSTAKAHGAPSINGKIVKWNKN